MPTQLDVTRRCSAISSTELAAAESQRNNQYPLDAKQTPLALGALLLNPSGQLLEWTMLPFRPAATSVLQRDGFRICHRSNLIILTLAIEVTTYSVILSCGTCLIIYPKVLALNELKDWRSTVLNYIKPYYLYH